MAWEQGQLGNVVLGCPPAPLLPQASLLKTCAWA